jgi:putative RNA 2'-phosphotransferase
MNPNRRTQISKFLSLVLRHKPETIGITLDDAGWVDVRTLLLALDRHGKALSREDLEEVVATNDKKRFAFSDDGRQIRASQGHSVEVDLQLDPIQPPDLLYHGTADRFVEPIRKSGLCTMSRQHVHLSPDTATASKVGVRHGRLVLLTVRAGAMHVAGHAFYRSANGVWLTDHVPPEFIEFPLN